MAELKSYSAHGHEAGVLGRLERDGTRSEVLPRAGDERAALRVVGREDEQQKLSRVREPANAVEEHALQPTG